MAAFPCNEGLGALASRDQSCTSYHSPAKLYQAEGPVYGYMRYARLWRCPVQMLNLRRNYLTGALCSLLALLARCGLGPWSKAKGVCSGLRWYNNNNETTVVSNMRTNILRWQVGFAGCLKVSPESRRLMVVHVMTDVPSLYRTAAEYNSLYTTPFSSTRTLEVRLTQCADT